MGSPASERARSWAIIGVGALGLALAAMAVCGYRFGAGDQAQYLVRAVDAADPGALAGDPYLDAFGSIKSYAWDPIGAAVPEGWWAAVALGLTIAAAMGSALALAAMARALIAPADRRGVTGALACLLPAALLVVPKELNWFGLVSLADMEFTATLLVMPIVLVSMALFVRGRPCWSLGLAVLAVPVHGQTAAYALCAWTVGMLWVSPWRSRAFAGVVGVACVGAIGFVAATAIGPVTPAEMNAYRETGLELYAPLIEPARAPFAAWGACLGVIVLGWFAWPGVGRGRREQHDASARLLVYALASMAFPIVFTALLAAGWREPLAWRLMPGRGLMLAQIAAIVSVAAWSGRSILTGGRGAWSGAWALGLLALWPFGAAARALGLGDPGAVVGAVGLAVIAGLITHGVLRDAAPAGVAPRRRRGGMLVGVGVLIALVGVAAFVRRPHPWTRTAQPEAWREAQAWAREHTEPGTVFITPPYRAGWRVGSHRPTYGELRDGGLLFYAGDPVLAWAGRMRTLDAGSYRLAWYDGDDAETIRNAREGYDHALRARGDAIAAATGAAYVVREIAGDGHDAVSIGERVWDNGVFEIRSTLTPARGGRAGDRSARP